MPHHQAEIEIGAVRPDELESLLGLICEVFQLPYEPARELFYKDPYLNLDNKRVLRINGRIVSCLTIADREVWLANSIVRVGGIAGVATHPEQRNKGYAGRLLENTLDFLKTQGYALSALIPYSAHFYRRFGYEICGNACRFVTAPSYLPASREIRSVRPARPDDIEGIEFCYSCWATESVFRGLRDSRRWQYLLQNVEQCHVYTDGNNKVEGYILSDIRHTASAFEGDVPMPTLRVLELATRTFPAERGLLAHLAAQQSVGMIEFSLPSRSLDWLIRNLMGTGIGEEILANIEVIPMLMVRIVNFSSLIKAILPMTAWNGGLRLDVRDMERPNNPESWTILRESKQSGDIIRRSVPNDYDLPCLSADIRAWAQLATGFKSADDAIAQGLLFASDDRADYCGSELFPTHQTRHPFLPLPDHF